MASPRALVTQNYQEPYDHKHEDPYYKGLLDAFHSSTGSQNLSRSASGIGGTRRKKPFSYTSEKLTSSLQENSGEDIIFDMFQKSSSRSPKVKTTKFVSPTDWKDFGDPNPHDSIVNSGPPTLKADEGNQTLLCSSRATFEKKYIVNKRNSDVLSIELPRSAASFSHRTLPQLEVVELCESTSRLNLYLKAGKGEVNSGVPGRFLHAVMGQDVSDVGSVASTIMYAFYLSETRNMDQFYTVPIINMKRADLSSHAELKWLLESCQIDQESLIFIDEIDLSYYDLFGSLKLVLLNGHKLPTKQEALKGAVVEILTCRKGESAYSWVENVTKAEDCSCCTVVAEMFALTSPEILTGKCFSRLLLAGILLDSANLTSSHCSSKDKYMATLLLHGAGCFGWNGFYQILKYKMYNVSDLKVIDILRKDFKKWTRPVGKSDSVASRLTVSHIGMSSILISVAQLLAHEVAATQEIKYFQQLEKLRLLMIVSGYYDSEKNFKREILVTAESVELMKNLLSFFNSNKTHIPLKVLHKPGLKEDMRMFEIDKVVSRKTIEHLLEEFGGTSKG